VYLWYPKGNKEPQTVKDHQSWEHSTGSSENN